MVGWHSGLWMLHMCGKRLDYRYHLSVYLLVVHSVCVYMDHVDVKCRVRYKMSSKVHMTWSRTYHKPGRDYHYVDTLPTHIISCLKRQCSSDAFSPINQSYHFHLCAQDHWLTTVIWHNCMQNIWHIICIRTEIMHQIWPVVCYH